MELSMRLRKLLVITASAVFGLMACSDESSPVESGGEIADFIESSGTIAMPIESSSAIVNPAESSGTIAVSINSSSATATPVESSASVANLVESSSTNVIPVNSSSSITVPVVNPPVSDDTDLEDARTLDGSEILLKLSGTSASVENNNGCVEVADKVATITCPGATT